MDNEAIVKQFEEIEQNIEKLIQGRKLIEAENLELKNRIDQLESELQGKVDAENTFTEERALIRSKIDGLLSRLEDS
ncbi:MAG: DUF904 domain-containing protein [Desulfobacterales bacterium]|nr:DUF904 domain-containing protein [Desulfobacterales bacterium]